MRNPIFVSLMRKSEHDRLKAGLCSPDDFELRRCQFILAAEVSFEHRLIQERISVQTIRVTLERMGVKWA